MHQSGEMAVQRSTNSPDQDKYYMEKNTFIKNLKDKSINIRPGEQKEFLEQFELLAGLIKENDLQVR